MQHLTSDAERRQAAEQGAKQSADCTLKWCGGDCIEVGGTESQSDDHAGDPPVCGENDVLCSQIPLGCEYCAPPILELLSDGIESPSIDTALPGLEDGMGVFTFADEEAGFTVTMRAPSVSSFSRCNLLCWTLEEVKQSGGKQMDGVLLPKYPIPCGKQSGDGATKADEPCGNTQNLCVDFDALRASGKEPSFTTPFFFETAIVRARMYHLGGRLSSPETNIYVVNKKDLVSNVICGDGVTVNRLFNTSDIDVEQCDDGNLELYDGCDEHCLIEPGWVCRPTTGMPLLANCTATNVRAPDPSPTDMWTVFFNFGCARVCVCAFVCVYVCVCVCARARAGVCMCVSV